MSAGYMPGVNGISPTSGTAGTLVTLSGLNFISSGTVTAITFNGYGASSWTVVSNNEITVTAPIGGTSGDIRVTAGGQTSDTSSADIYTYLPKVTSLISSSGPATEPIQIFGSGFTGVTAVMFGSLTAAAYLFVSDTQIEAYPNAGGSGTVHVTVTTSAGTSATSSADLFTYTATLPVVTGVSPNSGPTAGNTQVTITGSLFTGATAVKFGSTNATSYSVITDGDIVAYAPAGSAGTVDVTVTTSAGTSATSSADQYTYVVPPTVTGISPGTGPLAGGTSVAITGTGFQTGTVSAVKFGASAAASYTVNSDISITAVSPAGSAGTVDITVTTQYGTSAISSSDQYLYRTTVSPVNMPYNNITGIEVSRTMQDAYWKCTVNIDG